MSREFDVVLFAAGKLLNEWTYIAHELTPEQRLDALATFMRAILDRGNGTWVWPPDEAGRESRSWPRRSSLSAVPGTETEAEKFSSSASTAVGRDVR